MGRKFLHTWKSEPGSEQSVSSAMKESGSSKRKKKQTRKKSTTHPAGSALSQVNVEGNGRRSAEAFVCPCHLSVNSVVCWGGRADYAARASSCCEDGVEKHLFFLPHFFPATITSPFHPLLSPPSFSPTLPPSLSPSPSASPPAASQLPPPLSQPSPHKNLSAPPPASATSLTIL